MTARWEELKSQRAEVSGVQMQARKSKDKNYAMCEVGELSGMESCEVGD